MSKEQVKAYLKSGKIFEDLTKKATEAGYEVSEDDLKEVFGGGVTIVPVAGTLSKDGAVLLDGTVLKDGTVLRDALRTYLEARKNIRNRFGIVFGDDFNNPVTSGKTNIPCCTIVPVGEPNTIRMD